MTVGSCQLFITVRWSSCWALGLSHLQRCLWWTVHGKGVLFPEPGLNLTAYQKVTSNLVGCYSPSLFNQSQWLAFSASSESSLVDLLSVALHSPRCLSRRDVDLPTKPLAPTSTGYSLTFHLLSLHSATRSAYFAFFPPPMALSARSVLLTSRLQTTAPHLVLRWCCRFPVGTGAAYPGPLPSSTPPLVLKVHE